MSLAQVKGVQHLTLEAAAAELGMGTTQVRVEVLRALHPIHACAAWHCICRIPAGCTCTCPAASLRTRCCFRLAMSIPDSNPAYARRPAHAQLKLQCRKLGIPRWPYRRLKSIRNMARTCETTAMRANSSVKRQLQAWASQLHALEVRAVLISGDLMRVCDACLPLLV